MATINQPKPSEPKGTQPDQQPIQPGGAPTRPPGEANPQRPNKQTPERSSDRIHGNK